MQRDHYRRVAKKTKSKTKEKTKRKTKTVQKMKKVEEEETKRVSSWNTIGRLPLAPRLQQFT
ncbi:hypothetical protein GQ600_7058 [Phytophthora cactorum]|nr:hypothetical protein GQ600_7058 [Phytophthora cactorum]